jgi:hypothetical protein
MPHHPPKQPVVPDVSTPNANFAASFFAPARSQLDKATSARVCRELPDADRLQLGVRRALEERPSGRGFLQHLISAGLEAPATGHFFETLKSERRLALIAECAHGLARSLPALEAEFWAGVPELAGFETYAGDGHFHAAAAHDSAAADDGVKYATGHFFSLHLRTHALAHLTVADQLTRKREHDMHALKRLSLEELRQGAPKGRQVLYVYDRAGIDFQQWHQWKHVGALCIVSREKENMKLARSGENAWDRADPRNAGVLADELVATSQGESVRRVRYHCVVRGEEFSFLTGEYTLPPGVIAHLCRPVRLRSGHPLRWEIEKTFDELKNKLGETKASASSATAKAMQAHFLCLAHNLMILCEAELARVHGVRNEAEITRRAHRLEKEEKRLAKENLVLPLLVRTPFARLRTYGSSASPCAR